MSFVALPTDTCTKEVIYWMLMVIRESSQKMFSCNWTFNYIESSDHMKETK